MDARAEEEFTRFVADRTFPGHPLSSWWVDDQRLLTQSDRLTLCGVRRTGPVESCATLPTAFFQLDLAVGPA